MRPILLDKIASVTLRCELRREVRVDDEYPCREGDVLAVRLLTDKSTYNVLELATGRMSNLKQGDVIAGALGHRNAVQGYAGTIPTQLKTGDRVNLLNMGGVLGICHSWSPLVGPPHECEVVGAIQSFPSLGVRKGVAANIAAGLPTLDTVLTPRLPKVVTVAGTSMNSGKTEACLTIIQQLVRQGLRVSALKSTGVSLRRDVLGMQDAGASEIRVFTDLGVVTTQAKNAPALTRTMLNQLGAGSPDVIVMELGDGLIGEYGVSAILDDPHLRPVLGNVVLAASDPVAAWGGVELLRTRHGISPLIVTGPVTDNQAGIQIVERETGVRGLNARHHPGEICTTLLDHFQHHA